MSKKFFVSLVIILCAIFSFTFCFATENGAGVENAVNDVRNFVGGVEDTVENAAKDVSNASKDATGDWENGMQGNEDSDTNNGSAGMGTTNGTTGDMKGGTTGATTDNGGYTATRVDAEDNSVLGMSSTAWTWLILGIAAIAIIALVWYYSMQFTNNNNNNYHNDD